MSGRISELSNVGSDEVVEVVVDVLHKVLEHPLHGGDVRKTDEDLLKEVGVQGVSSGH